MPIFRLPTMPMEGVTGITAKAIKVATITTAGASTNTTRSAKGGVQSCLNRILIISATTCNEPKGPTRFGPRRSCQKPSRRRSIQVRSAAPMTNASRMPTMLRSPKMISRMTWTPPLLTRRRVAQPGSAWPAVRVGRRSLRRDQGQVPAR